MINRLLNTLLIKITHYKMLKKNIVYLSGGLGNQMFQYAFARALYLKYNIPFEINTDFYRRRFEDQTSRDLGLNLFKLKFKESRFTNLGRVCLGIKKILLKLRLSWR